MSDEPKTYVARASMDAWMVQMAGTPVHLVAYAEMKLRAEFLQHPEVPQDHVRLTWTATVIQPDGTPKSTPWEPTTGWPPYCTAAHLEARYETEWAG